MSPDTIPPRPGSGAARRAKAAKHKARHQRTTSPVFIVVGVVALIAVALLIAVAMSGGSSSSTTTNPAILESRPVTVAGDALPALPDSGADPAVGLTVPKVSGQTFNGVDLSLPVSGKPTLTIFVAHWCPHCRKEVPLLTAWDAAGQVPAGVEVFAVATNTDKNSVNYPPSQWLETEQFPFAALADSTKNEAATAFGVTGFPFFVMTGADGKVLWRDSGEIPMADLTTRITDALKG